MIEVRFNAHRAGEFHDALNNGRPLTTNHPHWTAEDIFTLLGVLSAGVSGGRWRDPERFSMAHPEVREHMEEVAWGEFAESVQHLIDCMELIELNMYFDHYEVNHGIRIVRDGDETRVMPVFGVLNLPDGYLPPEPPENKNA